MDSNIEAYRTAYNQLVNELNRQSSIKEDLLNKAALVSAEELKIKRALDAIKPLLTGDVEDIKQITTVQSGSGAPFKWKATAFDLLAKYPSRQFTSPEILDIIYPRAKELSPDDRRRKMINLSVALSDLAENGHIVMIKNEGGRGSRYYLKQEIKEMKFNSLIDENGNPTF